MQNNVIKSGSRLSRIRRRESIQAFLMILPPLIGLILFSLYSIGWVIGISFFDYDGGTMKFVGLYNYERVFMRDPNYWNAVINTFILSGKLIIELPIALVLAFLLNNKIKGSGAYRAVFFMPAILSSAVIGLVFSFMFASYEGIINNILMNIHLISSPINWFGERELAMIVIIIVSIWQGVGMNMVFFLTGLQSIPNEVYESSQIDGASRVQQFFYITIPMLGPILRVIVMLAVVGTLKSADLILVLTNGAPGGKSEVMMTHVFKHFFSQGAMKPQIGYSAAAGTVSAIIIGIVTIIYLKFSGKLNDINN